MRACLCLYLNSLKYSTRALPWLPLYISLRENIPSFLPSFPPALIILRTIINQELLLLLLLLLFSASFLFFLLLRLEVDLILKTNARLRTCTRNKEQGTKPAEHVHRGSSEREREKKKKKAIRTKGNKNKGTREQGNKGCLRLPEPRTEEPARYPCCCAALLRCSVKTKPRRKKKRKEGREKKKL